jgi:hypothetical protein
MPLLTNYVLNAGGYKDKNNIPFRLLERFVANCTAKEADTQLLVAGKRDPTFEIDSL